MEITIKTSAENIEMANMLLGQAVKSAKEFNTFKDEFNVTDKDIDKAERFRKSLLKAFLKTD